MKSVDQRILQEVLTEHLARVSRAAGPNGNPKGLGRGGKNREDKSGVKDDKRERTPRGTTAGALTLFSRGDRNAGASGGKAGKGKAKAGKGGKKPGKSPDEPKRGGKSGKSGKKK